MKCAQEPSYEGKQQGITEEPKMNYKTVQREEQIPKTCRPQRQTKFPDRFRDYVTE